MICAYCKANFFTIAVTQIPRGRSSYKITLSPIRNSIIERYSSTLFIMHVSKYPIMYDFFVGLISQRQSIGFLYCRKLSINFVTCHAHEIWNNAGQYQKLITYRAVPGFHLIILLAYIAIAGL